MAKIDEKIEAAQEKLKQLKAAKQKQDARVRAVESKKARAADTRRKILVGAAVMGKWSDEEIKSLMDKVLTRPDDRALFGL